MFNSTINDTILEKFSGEWGEEPTTEGSVIVIRTANFSNTGKIDFSRLVKRSIDQKKVDQKKLQSGDIIIEKSGGSPDQPVGRVVYFEQPDEKIYLCNNFTTLLRPNISKVTPKYLFYLMHANHKLGGTLRFQNKTTGIINLKLNSYLESKIYIPPIEDQHRIVCVLQKIQDIIDKRRENLRQLDKLLESVFFKMFGNPVRNERLWNKLSFAEFSSSRLGKMRDEKYITGENTRKYIGNSNVRWFQFDLLDLQEMDFNASERVKFALKFGDLLICEGGEIGRCAIWRDGIEDCYYQKALHRVRLNPEIVLAEYIQYTLFCYSKLNGFRNVSNKSTISHLTGEKLKETLLPIPPIELQQKFALIFTQVEVLRQVYQNSLSELENLYGVLSQRAFKGELDLSRVPLQSGESEAIATSREPQASPFEEGLPDLLGIVADLSAFNTGIQAIGPALAALRASSAQMEVMNLLLEVSSPTEQWQRLPHVVAALQGDASTQDMPAVAGALAAAQAALGKAQGAQITALPGAEAAFHAMQQTFRDAQQHFPLYLGYTKAPEPTEALQETQPAVEDSADQDDEAVSEPVVFTKAQVLEAFRKHRALKASLRPTLGLPFSRFSKFRVSHLKTYNSFRAGLFALLNEGTLSQVFVWPKPPFRSPDHPLSHFIDLVEHPIIIKRSSK
jgi:type I restriction enzyme, S subunit